MNPIALLCLPAALLLATASAQDSPVAEDPPAPAPDSGPMQADSNGDGVISREEFLATPRSLEDPERAGKAFERLDVTGDGQLDQTDREARAAAAQAAADERISRRFEELDTNDDGSLSQEEFAAGMQRLRAQGNHFAPRNRDEIREEVREEIRAAWRERMERRIRRFREEHDHNGDGAISREEFFSGDRAQENPERAERFFEMIDRNGDGVLDEEDRPEGGPWAHGHRPPGDRNGDED